MLACWCPSLTGRTGEDGGDGGGEGSREGRARACMLREEGGGLRGRDWGRGEMSLGRVPGMWWWAAGDVRTEGEEES